MFWAELWKISEFLSEKFQFLLWWNFQYLWISEFFFVMTRTLCHVRPTKTQISLRIRSLISVLVVHMKKICILRYPKCHYENTLIQIYRTFHLQKLKIFRQKKHWYFLISAKNIDCGCSLEPPHRGGYNEYPQSMFLGEIRKIMYTPVNPSIKVGLRGSILYRRVFVMAQWGFWSVGAHVRRYDSSAQSACCVYISVQYMCV